MCAITFVLEQPENMVGSKSDTFSGRFLVAPIHKCGSNKYAGKVIITNITNVTANRAPTKSVTILIQSDSYYKLRPGELLRGPPLFLYQNDQKIPSLPDPVLNTPFHLFHHEDGNSDKLIITGVIEFIARLLQFILLKKFPLRVHAASRLSSRSKIAGSKTTRRAATWLQYYSHNLSAIADGIARSLKGEQRRAIRNFA